MDKYGNLITGDFLFLYAVILRAACRASKVQREELQQARLVHFREKAKPKYIQEVEKLSALNKKCIGQM